MMTDVVIAEMKELAVVHYAEVSDKPTVGELKIDWEFYRSAVESGQLKLITARMDHTLIGYWIFVISERHPRYERKMAAQDVLYIRPEFRGPVAKEFGAKCLEILSSVGVQVVTAHCKIEQDHSKFFEGLGFKKYEITFVRSL